MALKIYHLEIVSSNSSKRLLQNVVKELVSLDHQNIIKCFGFCTEKGGIVLELAEKTIMFDSQPVIVHSLRQLINIVGDDGEIPDWLVLDAMFQIAKGLEYLHSRKVNHGDLKSANVLVSGTVETEYVFLLADFGQPQSVITSLQGMSSFPLLFKSSLLCNIQHANISCIFQFHQQLDIHLDRIIRLGQCLMRPRKYSFMVKL